MRLQSIQSAVASTGFRVLAGLGLLVSPAQALTISPVLVELSPARRVVSITITNPGDRPLSFQTQVRTWRQTDGADAYADTDELFVVPPIAEIAAGGSQIFRVTTRTRLSAEEHAYRLIFEDVRELAAPATPSGESAISIRVNHDLPVFFCRARQTASEVLARPVHERPGPAGLDRMRAIRQPGQPLPAGEVAHAGKRPLAQGHPRGHARARGRVAAMDVRPPRPFVGVAARERRDLGRTGDV